MKPIPEPERTEICDEILRRIAEGESLRAICRDERMPDRQTFARWVLEDAALAAKYAHARELQADEYAERMLTIADEENPEDTNRAKLRVLTLQWVASKLAPKRYGDRTALDVGNQDKRPFVIQVSESDAAL